MATILACGNGERTSENSAVAQATEAAAQAAREDSILRNSKVSWRDDRLYDLTGDSREERISVKAYGPAYDSLLVLLEIFSPDSVLLYRDRWSSRLYFVYDYREGKPDTAVERIVTSHLKRLLSDKSFSPWPTGNMAVIDTMTIRYDLAEQRVREQNQLTDTTTLTIPQLDEIEKITISHEQVVRVATEVKNGPRFIYFSGGELTQTLAWSNELGRFVRVFSCC